MNKAELLAALELACIKVYTGTLHQEPDDPTLYSIKTDQATGLNTIAGGKTVAFKVLNEGVVAGPVSYADDVLDEDGVTVLHAAGDPVLDENGVQVVIPAEQGEQAFVLTGWPDLPKDKNEKGMAYLAGKVMDGTIVGFELDKTRADLGPFSFFIVTVWEPVGPVGSGEVTEKRWRVAEDANGNAFHLVIV